MRLSFLLILSFLTSCSPGIFEKERAEVNQKYANPNDGSKFIDIDGTNVHYRIEGKEDAPTILLLHGICDSLYTWQGWSDILKADYRVLRIDVPGFGLTYPVNFKDFEQATYVEFVEKLRKAFAIDKLILGGNSLGGFISWSYASAHPDKVSHLIMTDPAGYPLDPPWVVRLASWPLANLVGKSMTPRFVAKSVASEVYADDSMITDELVDRYYDMLMAKGNRDLYFKVFQEINKFASKPLKGKQKLTMPTLLIWGEKDKWIPVSQIDLWKKDVPHIQVMSISDSGHVPQEEKPALTAKRVLEFLK